MKLIYEKVFSKEHVTWKMARLLQKALPKPKLFNQQFINQERTDRETIRM